jgi:Tfp pilus assembly protein PilX
VTTQGMLRQRQSRMKAQDGVAMMSIMLMLILISALGIAATTITGLENRIAGFASTMEASSAAAEACIATGVKVIQQVLDVSSGGSLPIAFLNDQTPPGPVPATNKAQLELEIMGDTGAVADTPIGPPFPPGITAAVPNLSQTIGAYTVVGDIDRLYLKPRAGSGQQFAAAYDGTAVGSGAGGMDIYYRVDCAATNVATGMSSRIAAVYSCLYNEGCIRKLAP